MTQFTVWMHALINIVRILLAWLNSGRFVDLLSTRHHTSYLTRQRVAAFCTRIRLTAMAFSALTLIWIPFDAVSFGATDWHVLAICRVVASVVLLGVALMPDRNPHRVRALASLVILLAMPLSIYAVSQLLLAGQSPQGIAAVNAQLYRALPLLVLAGLSIFPLVVTEGLSLAVVIAAAVTSVNLLLVGAHASQTWADLSMILLMAGVYLLACAIQLHYMVALLHRANHDPLTGALTRRSGVEFLDLHFRLANDLDEPLSVLFVDADDFKSINDQFGHEAGDHSLKNIVGKLQEVLRQGDIVIRWGGEEFVVLLVNTPLSGAKTVVSNITRGWFGRRPDGTLLTASIGMAERRSDGATDWVQLIELADRRMYDAKVAGKARCVGREGVLSHATLATAPT